MERLRPDETELVGSWVMIDRQMTADPVTRRIEALTLQGLEQVADGGWTKLYRDPIDGRYWELTYPRGEMHGGGPPALTLLTLDMARQRYGIR